MKSRLLLMIAVAVLGACGESGTESRPPPLDAALRALADEVELSIKDVSVPFERQVQAPAQLQIVNRALQTGPPGIYVMRYSDDTLRQVLHVFVIGDSQRDYVKLTTVPGDDVVMQKSKIHSATYDEKAKSLILDTQTGVLTLTPQDVTPVGA